MEKRPVQSKGVHSKLWQSVSAKIACRGRCRHCSHRMDGWHREAGADSTLVSMIPIDTRKLAAEAGRHQGHSAATLGQIPKATQLLVGPKLHLHRCPPPVRKPARSSSDL